MELYCCFIVKVSRTSASHSFWRVCSRAGIEEWLGGRGGAVLGPFHSGQFQRGYESPINIRTGFNGNQVVLLQLFACQRVGAILRNIFLYETALVNVSRLRRHDWVLRRLARNSAEKHFGGLVEVEVKGSVRELFDARSRQVNSSSASMSQQKLVYSIIEFLSKSLEDGTVKQDDKEGLEVASASQIFHHRMGWSN